MKKQTRLRQRFSSNGTFGVYQHIRSLMQKSGRTRTQTWKGAGNFKQGFLEQTDVAVSCSRWFSRGAGEEEEDEKEEEEAPFDR